MIEFPVTIYHQNDNPSGKRLSTSCDNITTTELESYDYSQPLYCLTLLYISMTT